MFARPMRLRWWLNAAPVAGSRLDLNAVVLTTNDCARNFGLVGSPVPGRLLSFRPLLANRATRKLRSELQPGDLAVNPAV
ncbi:MAG: hypothetical protein K2X35_05910 [Bryobacteraceae bacterium]|nr:hypothetical protein [Bryobacteraceae bacterium]